MFARIKSLGWAYHELLTSGQMNQLDIDHSHAIDGVAAGAYTLTDDLELAGGHRLTLNGTRILLTGATSRVTQRRLVGPDSNATISFEDDAHVHGTRIAVPALNGNRQWTIHHQGCEDGDEVEIACDPVTMGSFGVQVYNSAGSPTLLSTIGINPGQVLWATFIFDGVTTHLWKRWKWAREA